LLVRYFFPSSFKGWFFLFVSWRMDAIKKKMQAMKVEKGGGRRLFPSYSLHIFHRPFQPDKFTGQMQSLLPMFERKNWKRPTLFSCRLIWLQLPPPKLSQHVFSYSFLLSVEQVQHGHACASWRARQKKVEPNKTTARKEQASSNVYFSLPSPALRLILYSLQVQLNLWEINRAKRLRFACKKSLLKRTIFTHFAMHL
jgi:hypothetical protein